MKKLIFIVPIFILCLTGCSEELESGVINCTLSSNDVVNGYQLNSTYKINYKGDYVESVETEEIVTSDDSAILDYFETTIKDTYDKTSSAYGGYDYSVVNENGKVISIVTIDYNEMNLEQFVTDQPVLKSYVENNKMLVSGIKSMYEGMGATCSE